MASITAENVSLTFPILGSDRRAANRLTNKKDSNESAVGGRFVGDRRSGYGVRALEDVSIRLTDGDRLGIYGHNGAGKSTLLRVLGGIYPPTEGRLEIRGRVSGMFSLSLGMNREATGLENIRLKALMYGLKDREAKALIPEVEEFSELGHYLQLPVKTYSSGMIMRLMFSIASALTPDILLLDEWISSGDRNFKRKVDERLQHMIDRTPIVVIASHNEKRIKQWSTKTVLMDQGRVAEDIGFMERQSEDDDFDD